MYLPTQNSVVVYFVSAPDIQNHSKYITGLKKTTLIKQVALQPCKTVNLLFVLVLVSTSLKLFRINPSGQEPDAEKYQVKCNKLSRKVFTENLTADDYSATSSKRLYFFFLSLFKF